MNTTNTLPASKHFTIGDAHDCEVQLIKAMEYPDR